MLILHYIYIFVSTEPKNTKSDLFDSFMFSISLVYNGMGIIWLSGYIYGGVRKFAPLLHWFL